MKVEAQKTLLLVEDEFFIAITEKKALEKYGYAVKTATTGEKAVEAVNTDTEIDLVLMDINLGDGIDGTQAAEIILKEHDIPIVFVSSHSEREVVEKTEKITSYGYVVKNSSIAVLDASIKMAFKLFDAKIAEHKKTAQLHENEEQYRLLHENAGVGIGYYSVDGIVLSYNNLAASHMGGLPEDFIGKSIFEIFPKTDAEVYHDRIKKAAEAKSNNVYEDIVALPSGSLYFLSTFIKISDVNGQLLGIQIISQDITERKHAEETLWENKRTAETLLNIAAEIIISLDKQGDITLLNESGHKMLGYKSPELIGKNWFDTCLPQEHRMHIRDFFEELKHGEVNVIVAHENDVITKRGKRKTIYWHNAMLKDKEGKFVGMFSSGEDITARKIAENLLQTKNEEYEVINEELRSTTEELQAQNEELLHSQEMLRQSESQFSTFMDFIPAIVFLKDADGRTLFTNKYMDAVLGSSGWKGKTMTEVFPNAFGEKLHADDMDILKSGNRKIEEAISHLDGTIHIYDTQKFAIRKPKSETLIGGIALDITKRKEMEDALHESERRHRALFDQMNEGLLLMNLDGQLFDVNPVFAKMHGYTLDELRKMNIKDLDVLKEKTLEKNSEIIRQIMAGDAVRHEAEHYHKDGHIITLGVTTSIITLDAQPIFLSFHQDITERKLAEKNIKTLLAEKELILKEVHHRIKNNMNAISSLISLQARALTEPKALSAFEDTSRRINSMQLLYQKLYQSLDFTNVSVKEYLPDLVDEIISNFPNNQIVQSKKHVDDFILDIKRLQPLGIIINELLTNIMKYAFKGRNRGSITVSAANTEGHIIISVQDDGIGMPDSFSFENSTGFGLQLVEALTQQLSGTIRIEHGNGTKVVLEFEA